MRVPRCSEQAKNETKAHGGNVFKITRVSTPKVWSSTCYRIRGEILLCKQNEQGDTTILSDKIDTPDEKIVVPEPLPDDKCSVEQVLKMKDAGLSDNQIKAACR